MIISLTGKPECGKSTAAKFLRDEYGFAHINVGDTIKEMLGAYYRLIGLPQDEVERRLYGDLKEKPDLYLRGKAPRYAMQTLGKEWRDLINPDLFAFAWDLRCNGHANVVADGMRYPEELGPLKARGGFVVNITRPGTENNGGSHIAEKLHLAPDFTMANDGTIEELRAKVDALVRDIGWGLGAVHDPFFSEKTR
jgi:hypothetical protein